MQIASVVYFAQWMGAPAHCLLVKIVFLMQICLRKKYFFLFLSLKLSVDFKLWKSVELLWKWWFQPANGMQEPIGWSKYKTSGTKILKIHTNGTESFKGWEPLD